MLNQHGAFEKCRKPLNEIRQKLVAAKDTSMANSFISWLFADYQTRPPAFYKFDLKP